MNSFRYNRCEGLLGGESDCSSGMEKVTSATKIQGLGGDLNEQHYPVSTTNISGAGFSIRCLWSAAGKLLRKEERGPFGRIAWTYSFDDRGHLLEARKDGIPVERYMYDEAGRRIADHLAWLGKPRQFIYYYDGSLIRLDDEYLAWTEKGQLQAIYDRFRRCGYVYGTDTRLDSVFLPSGKVIAYEYGQELMPVRVTEDSEVVVEYEWEDLLRLVRYVDIRSGLDYTFSYGEGRAPKAVTISGRSEAMEAATGIYAERLTLRIGVDQVDSIRLLATPEGRPVKYVEYDSFGNVAKASRAALRFPLGFACGLNDTYTGFVRFGFRDYHPLVGRFTAKDPAGYTGGDNDLWDYCVDDPVSCNDPLGLWTQANFNESKVTRDKNGRFVSDGSNESGGWKRQIGLGTAAVIDGLATIGDALATPARATLNYGNGLLGGDPEYFKPLEGNITNSIGLPRAQTERERFNYSFIQGTASILGAGGLGATNMGRLASDVAGKLIGKASAAYPIAGGAAAELSRKGAAKLATKNLDKATANMLQAAEGAFVPMAATPTSLWRQAGTAIKEITGYLK